MQKYKVREWPNDDSQIREREQLEQGMRTASATTGQHWHLINSVFLHEGSLID